MERGRKKYAKSFDLVELLIGYIRMVVLFV